MHPFSLNDKQLDLVNGGGIVVVFPPELTPIDLPKTTLALGEEGGWETTLALGEEGGFDPRV